jgi:TolB-like protein
VGKFFEELRRRNVVRVAGVYAVVGWVLVQIATTLEESMGLPTWFDGLIVAFLLIGLPVALLFAWAFELTPDGVVRTEDVAAGESIGRKTGRKLDYAIVGGIVVLGAIIVWQGSRVPDQIENVPQTIAEEIAEPGSLPVEPKDTFAPPEKSIAVLPFENRSPNPDDAFFADGMHDDLLTHLSKIRDMHVISRTSVMGYADSDRKIPDIARELGVATVMEGAVQRAGNRVRINVQLIDAVTDTHLWAEIYDRELTADNIFDIQSEITKAIATALNSMLSSSDKEQLETRPTESMEAYDAYMAGRLLTNIFYSQRERFEEAIAFFDLAISHDPDFAEAYAGKVYTQVAAYWYAVGDEPWLEWALESLQQAEALAPNSVEMLTARGYYYYWGLLDYDTANDAFERALDQSPNNSLTLAGYAYSNRRAGNFDVALAALEKAHRLDPMNHIVAVDLARTYAQLGIFAEARSAYRRAEAIRFGEAIDPTAAGLLFLGMGDTDRAWDVVANARTGLRPALYNARFEVALATRDPEKIEYALETWPEDMRRPLDASAAYDLARARALRFLGKEDDAHQLLTDLQARLNASENPYPQGWKPNAIYWPVELPGLLGDLGGVRTVIRDYESESLPDAWARMDMLPAFAVAHADAGDPDGAFDYIGRLISENGPFQFARLSVTVELDELHDDPRWLAHKADYEVWLAENGGQ